MILKVLNLMDVTEDEGQICLFRFDLTANLKELSIKECKKIFGVK
jgi:hypothetical protein